MKRTVIIFLLVIAVMVFAFDEAYAQEGGVPGVPPTFFSLPQHSVAATDGALSILANPAGLGISNGSSMTFMLPYQKEAKFGDWGFASKDDGFGFSAEVFNHSVGDQNYNQRRYTWGLGGGGDGFYMGFGYSWTTGIDRKNNWDFGVLSRPMRCMSFGAVARGINQPEIYGEKSNVGYDLGLAFRPLAPFGPIGNNQGDRLTITADFNLRQFDATDTFEEEGYLDEMGMKIGVRAELLPGVIAHLDYLPEVKGHLARSEEILAGMTFSFGNSGVGSHHRSSGTGTAYLDFSDRFEKTMLKKKSEKFVQINLSGTIVEQNRKGFFSSKHRTIRHFNKLMDRLTDDPEVKGIYLKMSGFGAGWAKMQEMRDALVKFKDAGKQIVVYAESFGNGSYYLASVADKIYLPPTGSLNLTGLAAHMQFLRGTLDWIGVEPQLEHIGKYKSYSDMMTRDNMSDAQAEATNAILDDIYEVFVNAIADGRGKSAADVRGIFDQGPFSDNGALEVGLVDSLVYEDQIEDLIKELADGEPPIQQEFMYKMWQEKNTEWDDHRKKTIAIIYGTGGITSGNSVNGGLFGSETMGSKTMSKAIKNARDNKDVEAIVFRVDSPGGSALASELITREVKRTTEGDDKKPFIVSMSDVAGSGGYYVACHADSIVAMPTTITGSIGVVSGKFNYAELQKKIKLKHETLRRGEHADMYAGYRSFTDEEWDKLRDHIDQFYQAFIGQVADGRGMDTSAVNAVGQGRIWSGKAAEKNGLIDRTGGLDLAIDMAARAAGIKDGEEFNVKIYPKGGQLTLTAALEGATRTLLPESVIKVAKMFSNETQWKDGEVLYVMPYEMDIK
ncbi:MAG: signal peptide peptidase SppA [Calditrichaeota bacterium]|jgi:protease-4|nr:signal peptide peptidase SppA [Calditrichota bacterium]